MLVDHDLDEAQRHGITEASGNLAWEVANKSRLEWLWEIAGVLKQPFHDKSLLLPCTRKAGDTGGERSCEQAPQLVKMPLEYFR